MKSPVKLLAALAVLLSPVLLSAPAQAQASRTWVSGVGDDANPCSRTAPCKTWAGAISKTAPSGEIDALDPGGFGALTITKAITLNGGGGIVASVLVSGTNGIVVAAGGSDVVVLRNLSINGLGNGLSGVLFNSGAALHIENCDIFKFANFGVNATPSTSNAQLFMTNDVVRTNTTGGINFQPSQPMRAVLNNVTVTNNGYGVQVLDRAVVDINGSNVSGNTTAGVFTNPASVAGTATIERSEISNNGGNGVASYGNVGAIRISDDGIFDNATGLGGNGGAIVSFGNNRIFGNGTNGAPTNTQLQH